MAVNANGQALNAAGIGVCACRRYRGNMITPEQLRAARVLVRWTRAKLAKESGVSIQTTQAFEQGRVASPLMTTEHKWRRALEKAGVTFLEEDDHGGVGVRLKARQRRKG
jgi:transcriptional regulator with XRE-family HTH domain